MIGDLHNLMNTQATFEEITDHVDAMVFQCIVFFEEWIDKAGNYAGFGNDVDVHLNELAEALCER